MSNDQQPKKPHPHAPTPTELKGLDLAAVDAAIDAALDAVVGPPVKFNGGKIVIGGPEGLTVPILSGQVIMLPAYKPVQSAPAMCPTCGGPVHAPDIDAATPAQRTEPWPVAEMLASPGLPPMPQQVFRGRGGAA